MSVLGIIIVIFLIALFFGGVRDWRGRGVGYGHGYVGLSIPVLLLIGFLVLIALGKI